MNKMNIYSMTGFGEYQFKSKEFYITVEIKTYNNRKLVTEVTCYPVSITVIEQKAFELIKKNFKRGSISCRISINTLFDIKNFLNRKEICRYITPLQSPARKIGIDDALSLPDIILLYKTFPFYFRNKESRIYLLVEKVLKQCIKKVLKERKREGTEIGKCLLKEIKKISARLKDIESRLPYWQKKVNKSIREMLFNLHKHKHMKIQAEKIYTELKTDLMQLFSQKYDVTEEINRFKTHIKEFISTVASETYPLGLKLEFICQEMIREITTLRSKVNDTDIIYTAIDIATSLNTMKEQIQNIE